MRKNATILIMAVVIFSLSGWIFCFFHKLEITKSQELLQKKYPLLSKRIFAENQNDMVINFIPLREALIEYIEKVDGDKEAESSDFEDKVGVYFEYLPSGVSIGINDREEISLASLSKVPLVMAIFKKIERGKISPDDILAIKKENLDQQFGSLWQKGEGARFSVSDLIKITLIESDNTAFRVLSDQLSIQEVNEVYDGLDIKVGLDSNGKYTLASPKSYSSIFKSLYLSSFLSKENSSRILEILTETNFNDGIPKGVEKNIPISHKVGIFDQIDDSQNVFIDCGIVYIPERPYIICVFAKEDSKNAQEKIAYISKMIYGYISIVKGNN